MLELVRKYKPVLRFLTIFLGSYVVLVTGYQLYLKYGGSSRYFPDIITHTVAQQSQAVITSLGYRMEVVPSIVEPAMNLQMQGNTLVRVVEGCNAVSVILLFIAFMLAFFGGIKQTLLFVFAGVALIYAMNVLRISLLIIGLYEYPEYANVLHGTVFPAVIYGTVFLLWLGWIHAYKKPIEDA